MEKHWVEELFPPTYSYSIDELLKATTISARSNDTGRASGAQSQRLSERSASTHNPQELYERVRMNFNQDIEERRQKSTQAGSPISRSLRPDDLKYQSDRQDNNADDDCLWSKSELNILRADHQRAKAELANITVQLKVVEDEKSNLERKIKKQSEKLEILLQSFHSTQQKCKRLGIKCGHLESELRLSNGKVKMLEEDVTELEQEKRTLKKLLRETQKELGQERRKRTEVDLQLQEDGHKLKMKHIATQEEMKLEYQMQINRLIDELRETQEEFEKERKEHSINKKALNHLRTHFASLPVGEINVPQGHLGQINSW